MLALLSLSEWIRIILVSPAFLPRATSNAPFCGVFVVVVVSFCFSFWIVVVVVSFFFVLFSFLFLCVILLLFW